MDRPSPTAPPPSYWCYSCDRFVWPAADDEGNPAGVVCPACHGGFLEEMDAPPPPRRAPAYLRRRNADPVTAAAAAAPLHRSRRVPPSGDRASPYNPVIVLRRSAASPPPPADDAAAAATSSSFDLFYDDGAGSGLRPLPDSMSDFLMGSGFERLLDQLAQIEAGGPLGAARPYDNPPASKAAVESMPTVVVAARHVGADSHDCAVCKDAFQLGDETREMPCGHMYHHDCILPWLALRNSCPVCRHELPTELAPTESDQGSNTGAEAGSEEETTVGLTIWRLPGGGFAVGRFAGGGRRAGDRDLPVVYTEVDGGFNNGAAAPRRISWSSRGNRSSSRRGPFIRRLLHSMFACFGHAHSTDARAESSRSEWSSVFTRRLRSRSTSQDGHADAIAR